METLTHINELNQPFGGNPPRFISDTGGLKLIYGGGEFMNDLDAEKRQKILDEKYGVEPERTPPFCPEHETDELIQQDDGTWLCPIDMKYYNKNEDGEFEEEV